MRRATYRSPEPPAKVLEPNVAADFRLFIRGSATGNCLNRKKLFDSWI